MAILLENLLGNVTGKLGKLILYERNGKICFRTKPERIATVPSAKQRYQREAFAKVSSFLAPIRDELEFGFSGIPGDKSKRFGKALSLAVKKAILPEEGEPVLYPERISTSAGDILGLADYQLEWESPTTLLIRWRPNSFEGNGVDADLIFYLGYDPQSKRKWSVREGAYRKNGLIRIYFPWSGSQVGKFFHFVSFYGKRNKRIEFSDSLCLGRF
ncbi:MAG: DUF6266 family protein [Algoriphagus aquaeductus]|uniref:Uncharacterized protein n=1 Tax=Algoriphagus aquaeductus TaxID=475299 RepID=A0A326RRV2_9BACT|nr:DUF6266 family protein [Algoriphagus aquaeductus]PZV82300.1 hypothetical protein CLV31_109161 [Algoriphagus aquaeductus]